MNHNQGVKLSYNWQDQYHAYSAYESLKHLGDKNSYHTEDTLNESSLHRPSYVLTDCLSNRKTGDTFHTSIALGAETFFEGNVQMKKVCTDYFP